MRKGFLFSGLNQRTIVVLECSSSNGSDMPEKRRRGQRRLASLETLSSVPPFHGEGSPGACCGFWLIGFELFVFKCIWVLELEKKDIGLLITL
ncbi:hypothetical protein CRENBAI_014773 [Crenichthys baileyi]|uniref:Uncharacterized protein n=1 Tax=Crenichthys baileyi TaxID=28760 RepID=A0AAV9QUH0_9TELE